MWANDIRGLPCSGTRFLVIMSFCCTLIVSCAGVGFTSEQSLTPLVSPSTTLFSTSALQEVPTSMQASTIVPSTSTIGGANQAIVEGPFPSEYDYGKCNSEAIRQDFGIAPQGPLVCAEAWAITRIDDCPPETECEGVDIFRWTHNGWMHRGFFNSYCVLEVDKSGLPRRINDQFLPGNQDCREPISLINEPPSGPITVGHTGERVRRLQSRLIQLNLLADLADGRFGPNTKNALTDFQYFAGLEPTGVLDQKTASALGLPWP